MNISLLSRYQSCRSAILLMLVAVLLPVHISAGPSGNDQVIMIVAYDGTHWNSYVASLARDKKLKRRSWQKIKTINDPVSITRQPETGDFFVKKDNGEVVHYQLNKQSTLIENPLPALKSDTLNYTQLRAYTGGALAVKLYEGKSRQTEMVNITSGANNTTEIIKQASAQFHPLQTPKSLFYGHVSCRLACDPVIQEVWRRSLVSGKTEQLTLLNSTTYLHSVDHDERFAYISSNQSGYYHLGRLDLSSRHIHWLTQGQVTDSAPSISNNNDLYFIRRDGEGTHLLRLPNAATSTVSDHQYQSIPLPNTIKKIRYLEITTQ